MYPELSQRIRAQAERYIDECGEYTSFYEREKLIAGWIKKEQDAELLVADFQKRAGDLSQRRVLELGFGSGLHLPAFIKVGAEMYGLEVNKLLLEIAKENLQDRNIQANLNLYDGIHMPYPDNYFDYIFATSVLEHVSSLEDVVQEANRILKPGGKFYISFPNRWSLKETHTGFYFINYLPRRVAEVILRKLGSNAVQELNLHFLSYFDLTRIIKDTQFHILFEFGSNFSPRNLLKRMLAIIGIHHSVLLKTIMVVLEKNE